MNQIEFGKLVVQKRKGLKLSQLELGRRICNKKKDSAAQKTISNIETGLGPVNMTMISALCRFLNIKPVPEVEQVTWQKIGTSGLFEPDASEEDIALIAQNLFIQQHLNQKLAELIRIECARFREIFEAI